LIIQEPPPAGIPGFLKGWGTLVIATVALIQPWVFAIWKKFFRSGAVDIYPSHHIEIGYSALGPTIGLTGTLRAVHRDQFVESMQVVLTKLKDQSRHTFDWVLFRAGKIYVTGQQREEMTAELVSSFMITTTQPHPYNILFQDAATQSDMNSHMLAVHGEWLKARSAHNPAEQLARLDVLYSEFMTNAKIVTTSYTALDRMMYWEPGRYSIEIVVHTTRPDMSFSEEWAFDLTPDDVSTLSVNPLVILRLACDLGGTLGFAYAAYQEPPPSPESD
jgi:hypothetical protein